MGVCYLRVGENIQHLKKSFSSLHKLGSDNPGGASTSLGPITCGGKQTKYKQLKLKFSRISSEADGQRLLLAVVSTNTKRGRDGDTGTGGGCSKKKKVL